MVDSELLRDAASLQLQHAKQLIVGMFCQKFLARC